MFKQAEYIALAARVQYDTIGGPFVMTCWHLSDESSSLHRKFIIHEHQKG